MKFLTANELADRLGEHKYPDVIELLDSALELATPYIEGYIRTKFKYGHVRDTFFVQLIPGKSFDVVALKLTNGFVDTSKPVEAVDADGNSLGSSIVLDSESGLVSFIESFTGKVEVDYFYGFEVDSDGVFFSAPEWLKNLAVVYASSIFHALVAEKNRDKEKGKPIGAYSMLPGSEFPLLQGRVRFFPTAYYPQMTHVIS